MSNAMQHTESFSATRYVEAALTRCQDGKKAQVENPAIPLDDLIHPRKPAREYDHDDETGIALDDDCVAETPGFDPEDEVVNEDERW